MERGNQVLRAEKLPLHKNINILQMKFIAKIVFGIKKKVPVIVACLVGGIIGGASLEYLYLAFDQSCPVVQCDIMDVSNPAKEAYCSIAKPETVTVTECVPRYIKTECPVCDTTPDYEEGRLKGWQECTHAERMNPIKEETKEECKGVCAIPRIQRR